MARPLKPDDIRRVHTMRVRVNGAEKSSIEQNARNAGLTPSDYLRVFGSKNAKPERNVPTPDREALLKILAELNMNGSNLNQIARAFNRRKDSDDLSSIDQEGLNRSLYKLELFLDQLMSILE